MCLPGYLAASGRLKVLLDGIAALNTDSKRKGGNWKVMGRDTFSREDYLVGEFATEEDARKRMRESESRAAKTQDEALRDTYWIVPPS
jgi:hypothetical protein